MLHFDNKQVRHLLLDGGFGLEKEGLRVTPDGHMAHSPDPFLGEECIVKDFSENQTEINTKVMPSPEDAVRELLFYTEKIRKKLSKLNPPEYLWPFSNPPYIIDESDIPIAHYEGEDKEKSIAITSQTVMAGTRWHFPVFILIIRSQRNC